MAPISEARRRANEKYIAKAYDEIKVRVPKGKKEIVKTHCEARGESVNGFINRAIDNQMERDKDAPGATENAAEETGE